MMGTRGECLRILSRFMNNDYNHGHRHKFHLNVRTVQTWEQGTRKTPDYVVWLIEKVMDLEEQLDAQRN